jgi:hypothetical protein
MPYRRLPNTDAARLKSLKSALEKGKTIPPFELAFSANSYRKIQAVLPQYENAISEQKNSQNLLSERNKEYQKRLKKIRLYISHFIQVVNMAIARGDLDPETRNYFGLEEDEKKLPTLTSEEDVIKVGKQLIHGEQQRRSKGLNPITNPTIAVLKVHFDKFMEYHNFQNSLRLRSQLAQDDLYVRRVAADAIIQTLWNEVEESFGDLPEEMRREKASEYGLIYVFRKSEMNNTRAFQSSQLENHK